MLQYTATVFVSIVQAIVLPVPGPLISVKHVIQALTLVRTHVFLLVQRELPLTQEMSVHLAVPVAIIALVI